MKKTFMILTCATILASCGTKETNTTDEKKDSIPTTNTTPANLENQDLKTLKDNVQVAWDKMILSDDEKLASLARLLDEISFNPKHNTKEVEKGRELIKKLKASRFTQLTLTSAVAEKYDNITDSTINFVFELANKTPDMNNYPLKNQLIEEINVLNHANTVAPLSFDYDDAVKAYNTFVKANADKLTDEKLLPSFTENLPQ